MSTGDDRRCVGSTGDVSLPVCPAGAAAAQKKMSEESIGCCFGFGSKFSQRVELNMVSDAIRVLLEYAARVAGKWKRILSGFAAE
jgi:hypothetical protein